MIVEIKRRVCDGLALKTLIEAGLAWLSTHQEDVNRLNVFPVPDGDTGNNMRLTMQKAYDAIAEMDEPHVGIVSQAVAKGALRGARGNSGVILSQLLQGFAEGLDGHAVFDIALMVEACQSAVKAGYAAVLDPTEGTILTVSREATEALAHYAKTHDDLVDGLDVLIHAARESLAKTPDLLPVLKKAGVVDSGGQGLVFILEGMARVLHGEAVLSVQNEPSTAAQGSWGDDLHAEDADDYGYDVQFLMRNATNSLDVEKIRADIDAMGWSTLVVGDANLVKVHVHVHDPGQPLSYAIQSGAWLDDIVVENMQAQYEQFSQSQQASSQPREVEGIAVVVVASGAGLQRLFYDELHAAFVIAGGQTMNPDVEDFLQAIDKIPNQQIVLLPNNPNIIMTSQQAAKMVTGKTIKVIPTRTIPQGISAMLLSMEARETGDLDEVVALMEALAASVRTGQITKAVRDSHLDEVSIAEGEFIGLLDNNLVARGDDIEAATIALLYEASADEHELITLYYGDTITESSAQALVNRLTDEFAELEFQIVDGGQPLYPYIISIE